MSVLGLPDYNPGSLSLRETRIVYLHGELRLDELEEELLGQGRSLEETARILSEQRNALRSWTRELMSDRRAAATITAENPNMSWDEVVAKYRNRGFTGDDLYREIMAAAKRSRAKVNEALGLDPNNPPPLPPMLPPVPFDRGPP
ncbi:hypothetical protein H7H82_05865 [Mycobacterium heidelbergense]|nr:hypothetical protein [Mycobacterium heidelbergense]MCV7050131.1 hypothetical protein [Mycobacterium heidelbergense]